MINLNKHLDGSWESVRYGLWEDLNQIELTLNQRWASTFTDGNVLQPQTIPGDYKHGRKYIANTGSGFTPKWDTAVYAVATDDVYVNGGTITGSGTIVATTHTRAAVEGSLQMVAGGAGI